MRGWGYHPSAGPRMCPPDDLSKMETSGDRAVHLANPRLQVVSPFHIRPVVERACGSPSKVPPHSLRLLSLVWTPSSPPFWDQYVIGRPLVQYCYVFIAFWLTINKSDGPKGAIDLFYTESARHRYDPVVVYCICIHFEPLYFLKLVHTQIQVRPTTRKMNTSWTKLCHFWDHRSSLIWQNC